MSDRVPGAPRGSGAERVDPEARAPQAASLFQERLAQTFGVEYDPGLRLRGDSGESVESLASERIEKLRSAGASTQRYLFVEEVGRGGMGAVLKVFDTDLRRNLAMKVVRSQPVASEEGDAEREARRLVRFLEEAQLTGQLDHPGIVPVHELGIDPDRRVYFTMRLVKGEELSSIFA
jgi:serine/threonine protein kinase